MQAQHPQQRLQRQLTVASPPQLWESTLVLSDTQVAILYFYGPHRFLLPAMDCGSKHKLLTAADQPPELQSSQILTTDLQLGLRQSGSINNTRKYCTSTVVCVCVNSTPSWNHVICSVMETFVCMCDHRSEDVTLHTVSFCCFSANLWLLFGKC